MAYSPCLVKEKLFGDQPIEVATLHSGRFLYLISERSRRHIDGPAHSYYAVEVPHRSSGEQSGTLAGHIHLQRRQSHAANEHFFSTKGDFHENEEEGHSK